MDFRILGPLEVVQDGESFALGPAQQRALLALLVLHRGDVVSLDRLVDELWGERAPATAPKTVQVYISHLRKALGDGVIVTERSGYRLAAGPERVDIGQFESLSAEGRRSLAEGDPTRARERLCSALALWRGEPLSDFAYEPFAQEVIRRLHEARLAVLEDRIEADLAVGRDGELIGELESLVSSNPLRERLRGQLMLALYRAGRQADALAVYRETSELLREELGLEPSPPLRKLERSILEQDTSLDGAHARAGLTGVCPFKGLAFFDRVDAEFFCGRERLVSDLLARLVESSLVGILGPSGIGKSSILRAGLLSALTAGALPGSGEWQQLLLRPGEHPYTELQRALDGDQLADVLARIPNGERIVIGVDQLEELFTLCGSEAERVTFLGQLAEAAGDPERRALVVVSLRADFYGRLAPYSRFAGLLSRSHVLVGPMGREELARSIEQPAARAGLEVERVLVDELVSDVAGEPGGLPLLSTMLLELWRTRDGHVLRHTSYQKSGGVRRAVARLAEAAYRELDESERRIARSVMLRLAGGEPDALVRRRVPLSELEQVEGGEHVIAKLTDARLLTVSDDEVELSHESLLREWPRYLAWLEEDRAGRRLHAHLMARAREWEATGREPSELYRGARLTGALDWAAHHDDQLSALERDFIQSSRVEAERQTRRLRALLLGVGALLIVAVVAGVIALINQQSASSAARVALARQLGAEAVNEPRLDRAMLRAREAVNLDRSPQTESPLLATLQRSPAVIGTFALPINGPPPQLALSPDGGTLAAAALNPANEASFDAGKYTGELHFYDANTHKLKGAQPRDFGGARPPVYSADGSLLAYPSRDIAAPSIVVRNAHTLKLIRKLPLHRLEAGPTGLDLPRASVLIAPDKRTVYCAYRLFSIAHGLGATYITRWSLPSGRLLSSAPIDRAGVLAVGLIDAGARIAVVDARTVTVFDAHSLRRLSSVAIKPSVVAPTVAVMSPEGHKIAIGSRAGAVSFIDAATGDARHRTGPHIGAVANLAYSPDGHAVASVANDRVVIWNPGSASSREVLTVPGGQVQGVAFGPEGHTLYTSSAGGLGLEWDLTGERTFGRRAALGGSSLCCNSVVPPAPPLATSPDGRTFAVRLRASTVGLFSARTLQRRESFTVKPAGAVITALAWSPTAGELAVGGSSGLVQLWRINGAPRLTRSLTGLQPVLGKPEAIQALSFSPDGQLLAASDNNVTVNALDSGYTTADHPNNRLSSLVIWHASDGRLIAPPQDLGTGSARLDPLAFSPNGRLVAVSAPDGRDLVLDARTAQKRQTIHPSGGEYTESIAFAPDGTLATGTVGGTVQLWNPISGKQVAGPLSVTAGPVSSIAFDPRDRRFATTGGRDGAAKLWFTSTLQQEGMALNVDPGAASSAAFERNGRSLLVIDDRGTAFSWPMSLATWEQRACAIAGRNLTRTEWDRFLPGRDYAKVCP